MRNLNNFLNSYSRGPFISLEGLDGAGKSTAIQAIKEELNRLGFEFVETREPGGTPLAEKLRELIKYHDQEQIMVETETNLFFASRIQNTKLVIIPALEKGLTVIADRYSDSTIAYQGARGQNMEDILAVKKASLGNFEPDLTLYLDVNLITSKARMKKRNDGLDNLEKGADLFFEKARDNYKDLAKNNRKRIKVINAMDSVEEVAENVKKVVGKFLIEFKQKQELKRKNEYKNSI